MGNIEAYPCGITVCSQVCMISSFSVVSVYYACYICYMVTMVTIVQS